MDAFLATATTYKSHVSILFLKIKMKTAFSVNATRLDLDTWYKYQCKKMKKKPLFFWLLHPFNSNWFWAWKTGVVSPATLHTSFVTLISIYVKYYSEFKGAFLVTATTQIVCKYSIWKIKMKTAFSANATKLTFDICYIYINVRWWKNMAFFFLTATLLKPADRLWLVFL